MIKLPPKIWRPKVVSKYTIPDLCNDINDGAFDFGQYGKCFYRPPVDWKNSVRSDIIPFNDAIDLAELQKDLRIGDNVDSALKSSIVNTVKHFWDCFVERGCHRTILGVEFAIDTGTLGPVCCKKPSYGFYEGKIIMQQINQLLNNKWIRKCGGPWGSMIVLAAKPHQENIDNIDDFIWRMCVSYRRLNSITRPFQYPIPRCDDSITILGRGSAVIFIFALDARQGYHQIAVKEEDQEKLAFFAPNNEKYCFTVMPFGPTNAPSFYTAMMHNFQTEWDNLFLLRLKSLPSIHPSQPVHINHDGTVTTNASPLNFGCKVIIDDILLWCSDSTLLVLYFSCVCEIFQKYRVSFKLSKCEFMTERVEYVGHDICPRGNCPAQSKFSLIDDWPTPDNGQSLFSFIGLLTFYHKFAPFHEMRIKPLRNLMRRYFRQPIPILAWTSELLELFNNMKKAITSSPMLARFDPDKPVFLKTDYSAEGMGWILMQPADDSESKSALRELRSTGNCSFDLSLEGPRLQPIAFGSRACGDLESKWHSFTGEIASGRWAISQNRRYLWGNHFFWLCDCSAVKEVLEYDGPIGMIRRWAQELLGYQFSVIHRENKLMRDVDALSRRFGKSITSHILISSIFHYRDIINRPSAYKRKNFHSAGGRNPKFCPDTVSSVPILTDSFITSTSRSIPFSDIKATEPISGYIESVPVSLKSAPKLYEDYNEVDGDKVSSRSAHCFTTLATRIHVWLCFDDILGSFDLWQSDTSFSSQYWAFSYHFSSSTTAQLFTFLHPTTPTTVTKMTSLLLLPLTMSRVTVLELFFNTTSDYCLPSWFQHASKLIRLGIRHSSTFQLGILWIPKHYFGIEVRDSVLAQLADDLPSGWSFSHQCANATAFGDSVSATRHVIAIYKSANSSNMFDFVTTPSEEISIASATLSYKPDPTNLTTICLPVPPLPPSSTTPISSPYVVATLKPLHTSMSSFPSSQILDPRFPATEPNSLDPGYALFGKPSGLYITPHK